jgi:hypothetical protein
VRPREVTFNHFYVGSRLTRFFSLSAAVAKFLSGPPGGRTLPHTATRLSDLAGGVYGCGASVTSTGLNAQRPPIKAHCGRDVERYYQVNILIRLMSLKITPTKPMHTRAVQAPAPARSCTPAFSISDSHSTAGTRLQYVEALRAALYAVINFSCPHRQTASSMSLASLSNLGVCIFFLFVVTFETMIPLLR